MTRTVLRYVQHTIRHVPESGICAEAFCCAADCQATSGPQEDSDAVPLWRLEHTGRTGHDLFRRQYTDYARVTRTE